MADVKRVFKFACKNYLQAVSIATLRVYGRTLGLQKPTALRKEELIEEIVSVLCGESAPTRKNIGAPVKDDYLEPIFLERVNKLREEYFSFNKNSIQSGLLTNTPKEDRQENQSVSLSFFIDFSALTELQKRKLAAF